MKPGMLDRRDGRVYGASVPALRPAVGARLAGGLLACVAVATAPVAPRHARAQDLGHKLLGAVGIDAGVEPEPGLYLGDRIVLYDASRLRDRNGAVVPIEGLDIGVIANSVGASLTVHPRGAPYLSFAFSVPWAGITLNSVDPLAAVDRFGFGDMFVQPLKLGWRFRCADLVASYELYAPTGHFEPRGSSGVGRGFWSHQLSLGGAVVASRRWSARASALLSYDINLRKRGIDLRRGNTLQIQGGAGMRPLRGMDAGVAFFALWQVTDDGGTDLPIALRGLRERVYGLGPEVDLMIPALRMRIGLRAEWDLGVRSRPQGRTLVASLAYVPWRPRR